MKAVVIYEPGGPDKLILEERPIQKTKPGWSLVKVRGCGINHSEIFTRSGLSPSVQFPRILGIECAGKIAETTDQQRLPVGQKDPRGQSASCPCVCRALGVYPGNRRMRVASYLMNL